MGDDKTPEQKDIEARDYLIRNHFYILRSQLLGVPMPGNVEQKIREALVNIIDKPEDL